jgi:hypothetical protein
MSDHEHVVIIPRRFRGPPDSANGGYACGMLGREITGAARVRLQSPPPLDTELKLLDEAHQLRMLHGELQIAEGFPIESLAADVPGAVSYDVASEATRRFPWYTGHPFSKCFVCGPDRHPGDGLCIFPGIVDGREVVAAPWIPDYSVCDRDGHVFAEVVWASLDCPSWFGLLAFEQGVRWALLGQLTARVLRRPAADEKCVAIGWSRGRDGRKLFGGSALFTDGGELLGHSEAVWVELKNQ